MVAGDDLVREIRIALDERLDRARDLLLDEAAHAQQQLLQRLQLLSKCRSVCNVMTLSPSRCVTRSDP